MLTARDVVGKPGYYWMRSGPMDKWEIMLLKGTRCVYRMEITDHGHIDQSNWYNYEFMPAIPNVDIGVTE